jgi:hypothetical protein
MSRVERTSWALPMTPGCDRVRSGVAWACSRCNSGPLHRDAKCTSQPALPPANTARLNPLRRDVRSVDVSERFLGSLDNYVTVRVPKLGPPGYLPSCQPCAGPLRLPSVVCEYHTPRLGAPVPLPQIAQAVLRLGDCNLVANQQSHSQALVAQGRHGHHGIRRRTWRWRWRTQ